MLQLRDRRIAPFDYAILESCVLERYMRTFVALLMFTTFIGLGTASAQQATGTITGSVKDSTGGAVSGANVTVSGPKTASTTTDAQGNFTLANVPAGIYTADVSHGGYLSHTTTDVTVLAGTSTSVAVTLERADLSSLRTIARVTTSSRTGLNRGSSEVTVQQRVEFQNLAAPQINDVLQRAPGVVIQHGSSSPNTSITVGGVQAYETQVLLDGHPLSAGRYGVWFSQFFNSFLVQNIETEVGPGNTTPFAGTAVGGTANIVTPAYTSTPRYDFITGADSYDSQYSSFLTSSKTGHFSYVLGAGYSGDNGPYQNKYGCILDPYTSNGKNNWNTPGAQAVISFCGQLGGPQFSKGEILKARWDFSPTTSLEFGYVGSQGGYNPQASSYGIAAGLVTIVPCLAPSGNSGVQQCNSPGYGNYAGQTINGYFFYPGSVVTNNQPLFTGQLRTAIGNNTILVRPYAGSITRIINGSGEVNYPLFSYVSGAAGDAMCKGNPVFGVPGASSGGYTTCMDSTFSVLEQDKLFGNTLSVIHPIGDTASITGTYDYHSDETFAYYNNPTPPYVVPDTTARFTTLSLTGDTELGPKLRLKAGLYDSMWKLNGTQTGSVSVSGSTASTTMIPLTRTVNRIDPHAGLIFAPSSDTSMRLSFGTSTTFPYAAQVSGASTYSKPSGTGTVTGGTLTQKNPDLAPERATEADLGFDKRLWSDTVLSLDLISTNVSNVFQTPTLTAPPGQVYNYIYEPVNASNLQSQLATLTLRHAPRFGLGYYATVAFNRSVASGIPITSKAFVIPANGIQQCSDGGSATCIPYSKGYASLSWTFKDGSYAGMGVDYEGKNNTYFQGPMAIFDLTLRRPVTPLFDLQLSTENLFNSNTGMGMVTPNAGASVVGENGLGQYGTYVGSTAHVFIPVRPRTVRLQLHYHIGEH